ncbi:MAG: tetratricopeptide repeat protein [Breznakibacter sp.]
MSKLYYEALNYADAKDFKKAIPIFKKVLKDEPQSPEVFYYLGYCYMNTSEGPDSAVIYFEKGLQNLPESDYDSQLGVDMRMSLAKSYHLAYRTKEAIGQYDKLLAIIPANANEMRTQIARDIETCHNLAEALKKPVMMQATNAGKTINSKNDDHSPLISADGSLLFFTTRRASSYSQLLPDGQYSEKIFFSKRDAKTGEWEKPTIINKLFKREGHESCVSLSADGTELYLFRNDIEGKNLYLCTFDGTSWSEPVKMPRPINSEYNETHLTLSPDKSVAYFTSDRPGGMGGLDIYEVRRLPDGGWAKPRNLGAPINSAFDEETPMLHPDGKTLYFSSEGHNSIGGLDIFTSQLKSDSTWSAPINMGYPINTPDDDFFFVPTATYNQAWYASARFKDTNGGHDLYMIQYEEAEESKLAVLKGEVNTSEDTPLENIRISITEKGSNELLGVYKPHPGTGKYVIIAEWGKNYLLDFSGEGFMPINKEVSVTLDMTYAKLQQSYPIENIQMVAIEKPDPIVPDTQFQITGVPKQKKELGINDGIPYYTVQILTLRKPASSWDKIFKGLEPDMIIEYKCKGGIYRYSYGRYKGFKAAVKGKEKILKNSTFQDSFIRDIKQYDELIENE